MYDENGKITGYQTKVGADAVFPFNSMQWVLFRGAMSYHEKLPVINYSDSDDFYINGNTVIFKRDVTLKFDVFFFDAGAGSGGFYSGYVNDNIVILDRDTSTNISLGRIESGSYDFKAGDTFYITNRYHSGSVVAGMAVLYREE